jgi:predicted nucleic acid-binding protein
VHQSDEAVINAALGAIREKAFGSTGFRNVRKCADLDDDIFLACAQAARAAYLVTAILDTFLPPG